MLRSLRPTLSRLARCAPVLTLAACLSIGPASRAAAQTFIEVNSVNPTIAVIPYAGSQDGSVLAGFVWPSTGIWGSFRWTQAGGLVPLPPLAPNSSQIPDRFATGISRNGLIVAGVFEDKAWRWTQAGGMLQIGPFAGGAPTVVNGVSGNGLVFFGRAAAIGGLGTMRAMRWTQSGGVEFLTPLQAGLTNSTVSAVTPNGAIAIGTSTVSGIAHPTVWPTGTTPIDLWSLWSAGPSSVYAMSDSGSVLWGAGDINPNTTIAQHALRYRLVGSNYVVDDMGAGPGWGQIAIAGTVPDGSVHVGVRNTPLNSQTIPYLWSTDLGYLDLVPWMTALGINSSGYQVDRVNGISADGTAIWGSAIVIDKRVGWVARGIPCLHKPFLVQETNDQVLICAGETAHFSTGVGGNYTGVTFTYQWYKNGVPLSNGASGSGSTYSGVSTPNLSIANISAADDAAYSCDISNACGTTSGNSGQLIVQSLPQLLALPAPGAACVGGSTSITVNAINATNYQWSYLSPAFGIWMNFVDGVLLDPSVGLSMTVSGSTTPTLSLSGVILGEISQLPVQCDVSNPCRALRPVTSSISQLFPPQMAIQPSDQYYCFATTSNFSASAVDASLWQWQVLSPTFNVYLNLVDGTYTDSSTGLTATVGGSTTPGLSFAVTQLGTIGNVVKFRTVATNSCGSVISSAAQLTICRADFNCDGFIDFTDFDDFGDAFTNGYDSSDFNGDGFIDFTDFDAFVAAFEAGC